MFEKNMRIAYLLDIYGEVLDDHAKSIMTAYYEDDLSLSEIAADENISRQGVRHIIKKAEEEIDFLESRLKLSELYSRLEAHKELVLDTMRNLDSKNALPKECLDKIEASLNSLKA